MLQRGLVARDDDVAGPEQVRLPEPAVGGDASAELVDRGLNLEQVRVIEQYLALDGSNEEKLTALKALFAANETGTKGVTELEYIDPLWTVFESGRTTIMS